MKIDYKASDGILISGEYNNRQFEILFSDIEPYWPYATEDDFESGKAKIFENLLIANIITSAGQGGLIIVWDLDTNLLLKHFESPYCVDFTFHNSTIYALNYVSYWGRPACFQLNTISIITNEISATAPLPSLDPSAYNGDINSISIAFDNTQSLYALIGEKQYYINPRN